MSPRRRHRVAVLALPGVLPLEFGAATQIFGGDPHYDLAVCAEAQTVTGSGFTITTAADLAGLERAETVIVPGYEDVDAVATTAVLDALRTAHANGVRLVSICSGAFALAQAGVLNGRRATTHWRWADQLQRSFPEIEVLPNRLFVDDGDVLTSAGVTTGIDLCLHLIRRDHGAVAANTCARYLVAPPQRHGGQAQYVERLVGSEENGRELDSLREWMRENLAVSLDLDMLAQRAHMSRRTLTRRFRSETGLAPMAWLTDARLDRARELLETTAEPVEKIGRLTGLGAPASVRAAFHRRVGTSPQAYRALFRHLATSASSLEPEDP